MRLIDADALGNEYDAQMDYLRFEVDKEDNPHRLQMADAINWCRNTLNDMPEIETVSAAHGEMWVDPYGEFAVCSVCKEEFEAEMAAMYKYCPSCGAKMDGAE